MRTNREFKRQPDHWTCPGCGRMKPNIARITASGEEVAMIVEHHDHIRDFPNERLRELFGHDWNKKIESGIGSFMNRIEIFTQGFEATLICDVCNHLDSESKKLVGADEFFSFSPKEIRLFGRPQLTGMHQINSEKLIAVYKEAQVRFTIRMDMAKALVRSALNGTWW